MKRPVLSEYFRSNLQYWSNCCATSYFFDFSPANVIGGVPRDMKTYIRGSPMEETVSCIIMAYCMDKQRSSSIPVTTVVMEVDF